MEQDSLVGGLHLKNNLNHRYFIIPPQLDIIIQLLTSSPATYVVVVTFVTIVDNGQWCGSYK